MQRGVPRTILQLVNLNEKYGVRLNLLSYLRLKTTIEKAAKIIKPIKCDPQLPRLTPLFWLCCAQAKGFQTFYKTFGEVYNAVRSTADREIKWNQALGTNIGPEVWDNIYK